MNIKNAITKVLKSGLFINLLVLLIVLGVILAEKDRIIGYFAGTGEHGNLLSSHSLVRFLASFLIAVFVCGYYLIYHRFNVRKKNRAELGFALILFILSLVSAGVFSVFFVIILGVLDKINFGYELMNLVYIGLVGFFIGFSSKIGI
ncbi:MAG: hypothetical protein PHS44_08385, partial [Candidatus Dojkabacteria bacterium]|nr:hypothetical protein [Candidatus Dojkabacteria bacterium]